MKLGPSFMIEVLNAGKWVVGLSQGFDELDHAQSIMEEMITQLDIDSGNIRIKPLNSHAEKQLNDYLKKRKINTP